MIKFRECFGEWVTVFKDGNKEVQEHTLTKNRRSFSYDMMCGETYWADGDLWSNNEQP